MREPQRIDIRHYREDRELRALIREIILEMLVAGNINSEASSDGQVLTSDGAGGSAWESLP